MRIRLAVVAIALFAVPATFGADSVYWGNHNASKLSFVALDASDGGDLTITGTTVSCPEGIALDPAAGRIYWANQCNNTISSADLDGSGAANLITAGATVRFPTGVALDAAGGRIYWANQAIGFFSISYANLNGSGGGDLTTTGATVNAPNGVALDPAAGRIYWANQAGNKISFANLNGSGGADLTTTGATLNGPQGVAIDPVASRIYWANFTSNKISYADLNGSGGADLTTTGATVNAPRGVAIDPAAGRIYWANYSGGKISYANLDGSGGGDLTTLAATVDTPGLPALLRAPSGTGDPAITGGSTVGSVLSCSEGSWAPDLIGSFLYRAPEDLAYRWTRNGTEIPGATSNSLTTSASGGYTCRVTATNHAGSAQQTSAAHTVRATLTTTKAGSGVGTVTSAPTGIDCGSTCSAQFNDGTSVTLTAAAAAGSTFAGWSGDCSGTGACDLTMSTDHAATATFESDKTLTVSLAGGGSGSVTSSPGGIACGSTCARSYTHGTSVVLTAATSSGSTFAGWSGDCTGTGTCTLPMNADRSAVATFESDKTLTVARSGDGAGSVGSSPSGIDCGGTCSHAFSHGMSVTLTATPTATSTFAGWLGDCTGTGTCILPMNGNQTVTAVFLAKCVVPKVRGMALRAAKSALTKAHCSLGKVTRVFSSKKKGRVLSQKPRPGATRSRDAKVNLVVSRGTRTPVSSRLALLPV